MPTLAHPTSAARSMSGSLRCLLTSQPVHPGRGRDPDVLFRNDLDGHGDAVRPDLLQGGGRSIVEAAGSEDSRSIE